MESKELRIDNWVKHPYADKYMKVLEVSESNISIGSTFIEDCLTPGEVLPIPITEEVLLALGAEKYDEENNRWLLNGSYYYDNCLWFGTSQIEVLYLHQLQNLIFSLSGEELEYKPVPEK